jgi:hypothetical protein
VSREALSLDISRVVSRVVSGEPIDTAENGAALAAKYPDLGMSATLISQAIERAAGMVGMIKSAPEPVKPPRVAFAIAAPKATTNGNGHGAVVKMADAVTAGNAEARSMTPAALPVAALPVDALSIEDDLAAAIDAEIGNLVAGQKTKPTTVPKPVSNAGFPAIQPVAAPPVEVAELAKTSFETLAEPATDLTQPAAVPSPASVPAADRSAPKTEPERSSIFSSFRRALFRT